jgi:2,3-dihydro-2,3-dihydroxybenzoate dehydrogenase
MWFDSPVSILNTNESKGYPVSAYLAKSIINIPIHSHYSHVEIDNIFNILSNETKKVLMARNKKFTDKLSVNNIQKTALVCGGSGALGLELIKILLKSHFKVVAQYNSHQNELYFLREKFKRNLFLIKINFLNKNLSYTNMLRVEKFLNGVGFGLIINTVAIVHFSYFSEISENEINKIYKLNLISQIILLKRIMRNLTCPAMLVTIITDSINNLSPGVSIYRSSKAALESFNKSLSVELYNQLIKIMCFSPYEFNSRMNPDSKYFASKTAKKIYSCLEKYNIKSGSNIIIK